MRRYLSFSFFKWSILAAGNGTEIGGISLCSAIGGMFPLKFSVKKKLRQKNR